MLTPWGNPDWVEDIAPGIKRVHTPSHGGFFVAKEQNCRVPHVWRAASFNRQALAGWYEEDCDWAMVVISFPETFSAEHRAAAQKCFDFWIAPKIKS